MTPAQGGWAFRHPLAAFRRFRQTLAVFAGAPAYRVPDAPTANIEASFRHDDGTRPVRTPDETPSVELSGFVRPGGAGSQVRRA